MVQYQLDSIKKETTSKLKLCVNSKCNNKAAVF